MFIALLHELMSNLFDPYLGFSMRYSRKGEADEKKRERRRRLEEGRLGLDWRLEWQLKRKEKKETNVPNFRSIKCKCNYNQNKWADWNLCKAKDEDKVTLPNLTKTAQQSAVCYPSSRRSPAQEVPLPGLSIHRVRMIM